MDHHIERMKQSVKTVLIKESESKDVEIAKLNETIRTLQEENSRKDEINRRYKDEINMAKEEINLKDETIRKFIEEINISENLDRMLEDGTLQLRE